MKFKVPISKRLDETVPDYVQKCQSWLLQFKQILRTRMKLDKILCRRQLLYSQSCIQWVIPNNSYDIQLILITFIDKLQCAYDKHTGYCYFEVSKKVRCPYTVTPLDTVIRILEYGTDTLTPLYWLRPAYGYFTKTILSDNNKRIY